MHCGVIMWAAAAGADDQVAAAGQLPGDHQLTTWSMNMKVPLSILKIIISI
jgi:hypothetical protein